ncbi:MAG: L,D-transpeptidase family protein [Burkholderiaceae bacterium]
MTAQHILISIAEQRLSLYEGLSDQLERWNPAALAALEPVLQYAISSSKNGVGQKMGSYQTPLGRHRIRAKIGAGAPLETVFVGRRPTGEVWTPALAQANPSRDWILTRILWLSGLEPGFNRFGDCDTMRRYVYLHGSPPSVEMGEPGSIGCIRMRSPDIVELFDRVDAGTTVHLLDA